MNIYLFSSTEKNIFPTKSKVSNEINN